MNELNELAEVIRYGRGEDASVRPCECDRAVAEAVIAAGYTKPRTITTEEELTALAHGAVIRSEHRHYWVAHKEDGEGGNQGWAAAGAGAISLRELSGWLPATVLWEPQQ